MRSFAQRTAIAATDNIFSIAIMPDTQREIKGATDTRFNHRADWLVTNKSGLSLRFVLQVGDLTDWGEDDLSHYDRASAGLAKLEAAGISYALCPGNHDTRAVKVGGSARDTTRTKELVRETPQWNNYFPPSRFPRLKGTFEVDKTDNCYHIFQAGGVQWLVIALEFLPRFTAVAWARSVVENFPKHNVIILTHMFVDGGGNINDNAEYGESSPRYMLNNLIKLYPNIKFVFSGHADTWAAVELTGDSGNKIYAFNDCWHHADNNPTRIVKFTMDVRKFDTYVYMPLTSNIASGTSATRTNLTWVQ
jgi:3',5'-cyclic AMP phosphodiesterase CpdA